LHLLFGGFFKFDLKNPQDPQNDRLIFSKGHAAPLFYSLYAAAGVLNYEELLTLRKFKSRLEGHPTMDFEYTEAATGSLGQGLSIGLGMALSGVPHVFVLLGDGEMAEGNIWEAMELSSYYKTANLIQLAMMAGAINGGASATDLVVIEELGKYIGFIFQIQDDILDIIGDSAVLGKQTGSDDRNNKSSIPLVAGLDKAKELIAEYKEISVNLIDKLPGNNNFFRELINFLVTREK